MPTKSSPVKSSLVPAVLVTALLAALIGFGAGCSFKSESGPVDTSASQEAPVAPLPANWKDDLAYTLKFVAANSGYEFRNTELVYGGDPQPCLVPDDDSSKEPVRGHCGLVKVTLHQDGVPQDMNLGFQIREDGGETRFFVQ